MTHGMWTRALAIGLAIGATFAVPKLADAAVSWSPAEQHGTVGKAVPGYFGVNLGELNEERVTALRLRDVHGVEIVRVDHDGPAGKAGLREHDVVVQMNGVAIEGLDQARRMLHDLPPGHVVLLVISRDGQQMQVSSQMADRDELERRTWEQHLQPQAPVNALPTGEGSVAGGVASTAAAPTSRYSKSFLGSLLMSPTYTGVVLEKMGPQLAGYFGVAVGTGLLVRSVATDSPAAMAGMRAGDVVVRANAETVATPAEWSKAVREAKGRPLSVVVMRERQEKTLTLTPDTKKRSCIELRAPEPVQAAALALLTES